MRRRLRYAAAIARRIRGPYLSLGHLDARLHDVGLRLDRLEQVVGGIDRRTEATHAPLSDELRAAVRAPAWRETENRERLYALRREPEYAAAWTDARPLISVTVATRDRPQLLATRSLPSILAQTYGAIEVIVVGDRVDDATADAVRALGDSRLVYRNLTQRLQFTEDPRRQRFVAATMHPSALNQVRPSAG